MLKKCISLLLSLIIVFSFTLCAFGAPRIPVYKVGNVLYFLDRDSGTITGFAGDPTDLFIPDSLGGYKINSIGSGAFRGSSTLNTLYIPGSISSISQNAFSECHNLKSVEIGAGVSYIGSRAFGDCSSLSNVIFGGTVATIESDAFIGTSWIPNTNDEFVVLGGTTLYKYNGNKESVTVPSYIKTIGASCFSHNEYVKEIILPEGLTKIGDNAFLGCSQLEKIEIPKTVSHIGIGSFDATKWLKDQPSDYVVINGILVSYTGIEKKVSVPEGITGIGSGAFMANSHIVSVKIPQNVYYIDTMAFSDCDNLISVNIPDTVAWIDDFAFSGCDKLTLFGRENNYSHKYAQSMKINFSPLVYVTANGKAIDFPLAPPVIHNEKTYVPIRPVMESLGWTVMYNSETKGVFCALGEREVTIFPDGSFWVNGVKKDATTPIIYINGCSLVSSRIIASIIGAEVLWSEETRTADFRF